MKSDDIKLQLDEINAKIISVRQEADSIILAIRAETPKIASDWVDATAEEFAKANPSKMNQLGEDWVKRFKADLEQFKKSIPQEVFAEFNGLTDYWPHQKSVIENPYHSERQYEYVLAEKFGQVVNGLAGILSSHGFFPKEHSDTYPWERNDRGRYKISNGIKIADKFESFHGYLALMKTYKELGLTKDRLEKAYEKEKANELWSSG